MRSQMLPAWAGVDHKSSIQFLCHASTRHNRTADLAAVCRTFFSPDQARQTDHVGLHVKRKLGNALVVCAAALGVLMRSSRRRRTRPPSSPAVTACTLIGTA